MSASVTAPNLILCENLTIDFGRTSRAHYAVGVIWRVAAIVCLIAAAALSAYLFIACASDLALNFEVAILFSSLSALTLLAFRIFGAAGKDELAQCEFYELVAEKERQLQIYLHEPEIKAFFAVHNIDFPKHPPLKNFLTMQVKNGHHFSRVFIPAIAHYKSLRAELTSGDLPIPTMRRCLDQLNLAMILQSMHRPCENRSMKLDNRFTDIIPGKGRLDRLAVIKRLYNGKDGHAFVFDKNGREEALTIRELLDLQPHQIRAKIFEQYNPTLNEPD